ncbi:MAG: RNA polymerase sigma factor [Planctomycetota bacterium]|jgi:RNA polymerase sigma-70 factor (ECF subfamily)
MKPAIVEKNACVRNMNTARKIFIEYGDFIYGVIRFNIKNEFEAEDVYHDIFLHLISKPMPEDIKNMKCFLYRIVSDKTKDAIRRIDRYNRRIQRYARNFNSFHETPPENSVIDREEAEKMFGLIQKNLSPKEVKAITLRYLKDDKISNVAEKMGIQKRSVSRYISVGLKKVRHVVKAKEGR